MNAQLTHFDDGTRWAACGVKKRAPLTQEPQRVACSACRLTKVWKSAWQRKIDE